MKKLYVFLFVMGFAGMSFAEFNPGNFQIRLVSPGGEPGLFRVQMRAIMAGVVPTTSDFCTDLDFTIWWSNGAIVDIDVDTPNSYGGQLAESGNLPQPGNSSGSGAPNGTVVPVSLNNFFQFPTNWVLNQWVTLCTVNICLNNNCTPAGYPAGITAADFLIQGFSGTIPNIQLNSDGVDYTPANGPLPLYLLAFNAEKSGTQDALLTWTTTNEENTGHFIVERSTDKKSWTKIGSVAAAGYSIGVEQYSFTDVGAYNGRDNHVTVYYRLEMVDLDGRLGLSPVQSVVFGTVAAKGQEFVAYPNPTTDGLQVEWDANAVDQPTMLEFYDLQGKLVYSQKVSDNTNQEYIDLTKTNMQPGLFMLRILNGTDQLDYKQIVVSQH